MDLKQVNKDRQKKRNDMDLSTVVYGKVPPQARDLEEVVLGAILLEKVAYDIVAEIIKPECFKSRLHLHSTR